MNVEQQPVDTPASVETMDTINWLRSQTSAMKSEREKQERREMEQNNRDEEMQKIKQIEDSLGKMS